MTTLKHHNIIICKFIDIMDGKLAIAMERCDESLQILIDNFCSI
jgi:hypothetical protein